MNLMKLFNFKYFKENIKKSKGLLAFFLGVVPLINIIILICVLSLEEVTLFDFNTLSIITYLGIYLIPIIMAVSFFGFVFKKKSVDFVMAKPLSRKTIYLTNLIGGILLILIFVGLNSFIFGLFGMFFKNLVIPGMLILDYFIFWFVSYVFMFVVASLAITLAGNLIGSIVVMLLITCLFPFFIITNYYFEKNSSKYIECLDQQCMQFQYNCNNNAVCLEKLDKNYYKASFNKLMKDNFTTPVLFVKGFEKPIYNNGSLIKMLFLSIIYGTLGYYSFKRRKMENNETSFKSEFVHYFVKTLTFIPVSFVFYLIVKYGGAIGFIVALGAGVIYYIVYDLITRKEIYKFMKSIIICVISLGFILLSFFFSDVRSHSKEMVIKNVNSIVYQSYFYGVEVEIKDKALINEVIRDIISFKQNVSARDVVTLNSRGDQYKVAFNASKELKEKLEKLAEEQRKQNIKDFSFRKVQYVDGIPLTKEFRNIIKELDKNIEVREDALTVRLYNYKNHKYQSIEIPVDINSKFQNYVLNYQNNEFLEKNSNYNNDYYLIDESDLFTSEDIFLFDYIVNENMEDFKDYIKNKNRTMGSRRVTVRAYGRIYASVEIVDADKFKAVFQEYKEKVKDKEEYKELLKDYKAEDYEY